MDRRWLGLLALALGACGGGTGDVAAPTTATPTAVTTAPTTVATTALPTTVTTAPSTTAVTTAASTTVGGVAPAGFEQSAAEVTMPDGTVCPLCLWVAETAEQRGRGLMGVTDLVGGDGMVFLYDTPTAGNFYMWNTPMPLSIAFFAADGSFVSATDMAPCLDGLAVDCPRYGATGPFTAAVETEQGGLEELGIVAGSRLTVLHEPCADTPGP